MMADGNVIRGVTDASNDGAMVDHLPDHEGPTGTAQVSPPALFSIALALGILLAWMGYGIVYRPVANAYSSAVAARYTQSGIDPNSADWASLVRLPGIGPGRAQKLLAWRKAHQVNPAAIVFRGPADLRQVPSFGPNTIAEITPYLKFPAPSLLTGGASSVPPP